MNRTDISYSFSLEDFLTSLSSDYSFSEWTIKIKDRNWEELTVESKKLYKEINNLLNINAYSTEDIKETFDNIISNVKNFFGKFKDYISTLRDKFDSFILDARSKNNVYRNFKAEAFKSLDTTIFERKLNENIIYDIEAFIRMCYSFRANFKFEIDKKFFSESFDQIPNDETDYQNQNGLFTPGIYSEKNHVLTMFHNNYKQILASKGNYDTDKKLKEDIENQIDNIFYSEKKEREMSIGEYFFNPKKGETPFLYELLSDRWLKKMEDLKKDMETFLNQYEKAIKEKKFEDFRFVGEWNNQDGKNKKEREKEREQILKAIQVIALKIKIYPQILDYFFSTFFTVRKKIEYYLLEGISGKIFPKKPSFITYPHTKYFDIKKPKYIRISDIPPELNKLKDEKPVVLYSNDYQYCDISRNNIRSVMAKDSNYFSIVYCTFNEFVKNEEKVAGTSLKKIIDTIRTKAEPNESLTYLIRLVMALLGLDWKDEMIQLLDFSQLKYDIKTSKNGKEMFYVFASFFITNWGHRLREEDILFHSSNALNKNKLSAFSKSYSLTSSLYPEPTFFIGLNNIMTKDGDIIDKDKSYNYFLKKIVSRAPELCDYMTFWGGRNDASTYRIYTVQNLPKDTLLLSDAQFYCNSNIPDPYWSKEIYPFRTLGIKEVDVEDITNMIWAAKDLGI